MTPLFAKVTEEEHNHLYIMQYNMTAQAVNNSMVGNCKVFHNQIARRNLWTPRSPDMNPCDSCVWGNLKDKVYESIPTQLKETSQQKTIKSHIMICKEFYRKIKYELCMAVEGGHFEVRM